LKIASRYKLGPIFTPAIEYDENGTLGVLMLPENQGGANWPGGTMDPETGILYVSSVTNPFVLTLAKPAPGQSDMTYVARGVNRVVTSSDGTRISFGPEGLPLINPPWG